MIALIMAPVGEMLGEVGESGIGLLLSIWRSSSHNS